MASQYNQYDDQSFDELRAEIEQTRARMGETIGEIQVRLQPDRLRAQAQETIRDAANATAHDLAYEAQTKARSMSMSVIDTIRENPVPAAMVGIGLGWMIFGGSRREEPQRGYNGDYERSGYYDPTYGSYGPGEGPRGPEQLQRWAGETVDEARDRISQAADDVSGRVSDTANEIGARVTETADEARARAEHLAAQAGDQIERLEREARHRTYQARSQFSQTMEENPLAMGAVAFAAGAAIGLAAPGTRQEDKLMGETRDRLVRQAQSAARDVTQRMQRVAEETVEAAREAAEVTARDEAKWQDLDDPARLARSVFSSGNGNK